MIETKKQETKSDISYDIRVTRASQYKENSFAFDMTVNGVAIYGCWYKQGKSKNGNDYAFIDFPSRKGNDGKFYNYAWFPVTKEIQEAIEAQIASLLEG